MNAATHARVWSPPTGRYIAVNMDEALKLLNWAANTPEKHEGDEELIEKLRVFLTDVRV